MRDEDARKPEARATFIGFDEFADVDIARRNLPHWQQVGKTYFVTFRLADSIPATKLSQLEDERRVWLNANPEPWTAEQRQAYYERFSAKIDEWLDAGSGSCVLKDERAAKVVADALIHFDGERYDLGAWVVMPNHVHVVVTPRDGHQTWRYPSFVEIYSPPTRLTTSSVERGDSGSMRATITSFEMSAHYSKSRSTSTVIPRRPALK